MEYIHGSNTNGPSGMNHPKTLRDDVMPYKDMDVLVQTNEIYESGFRYVTVVELLEPLYDSSNENSVGLTKARIIEDYDVRKELTEKLRESGVEEPINFGIARENWRI